MTHTRPPSRDASGKPHREVAAVPPAIKRVAFVLACGLVFFVASSSFQPKHSEAARPSDSTLYPVVRSVDHSKSSRKSQSVEQPSAADDVQYPSLEGRNVNVAYPLPGEPR